MNKYLRYLLEIKSYSSALACILLISACGESEEARIAREKAEQIMMNYKIDRKLWSSVF